MARPPWIKLWTEEWLDGSIRMELSPSERSIWADLLALSGRSRVPGLIQANNGVPYTHNYLAGRFNVSEELLETTLKKCSIQKRIIEDENGIKIINWKKYQSMLKGKPAASDDDFPQYADGLRGEFPDLDIDECLKDFDLYNETRDKPVVNRKLAFRNWLKHAREYGQNKKGGPDARGKRTGPLSDIEA